MSEYDETQTPPDPPPEEPGPVADETPQAGVEVSPAVAEAPPEPEPYEPPVVEPAEPGIYYYEGEGDLGTHPVLGDLVPGENDFSEETHPEKLMAIAAMVRDGALRKV